MLAWNVEQSSYQGDFCKNAAWKVRNLITLIEAFFGCLMIMEYNPGRSPRSSLEEEEELEEVGGFEEGEEECATEDEAIDVATAVLPVEVDVTSTGQTVEKPSAVVQLDVKSGPVPGAVEGSPPKRLCDNSCFDNSDTTADPTCIRVTPLIHRAKGDLAAKKAFEDAKATQPLLSMDVDRVDTYPMDEGVAEDVLQAARIEVHQRELMQSVEEEVQPETALSAELRGTTMVLGQQDEASQDDNRTLFFEPEDMVPPDGTGESDRERLLEPFLPDNEKLPELSDGAGNADDEEPLELSDGAGNPDDEKPIELSDGAGNPDDEKPIELSDGAGKPDDEKAIDGAGNPDDERTSELSDGAGKPDDEKLPALVEKPVAEMPVEALVATGEPDEEPKPVPEPSGSVPAPIPKPACVGAMGVVSAEDQNAAARLSNKGRGRGGRGKTSVKAVAAAVAVAVVAVEGPGKTKTRKASALAEQNDEPQESRPGKTRSKPKAEAAVEEPVKKRKVPKTKQQEDVEEPVPKRKKGDPEVKLSEEQILKKQLKSRKSCAYHWARYEAINLGFSEQEAKKRGGAVVVHTRAPRALCQIISLYRYLWSSLVYFIGGHPGGFVWPPLTPTGRFTGKDGTKKFSGEAVYPMRFCKKLYRAFWETEMLHQCRPLRHKNFVDPAKSDREIFSDMELGDVWADANLAKVYFYARQNRWLVIPDSWVETIEKFDRELDARAANARLAALQAVVAGAAPAPAPAGKGKGFTPVGPDTQRMLMQSSKEVRRYLQSDSKGQAKCSKEMLELGSTPEGREKIRKMLVEKGSFDKVELVVKQWHENKTREETTGGYVTKKWLIDNKSFTQTMADNAFKWALPRGRCRKNVITGEEEADIPLDERWQVMKEKGQRLDFENGCELDDPDGCLLEATGFDGQDHLEGAGSGADAQLCFPALQQNTSPTAILPDFITVLGRIEEAILKKYVEATKEDLALNNYVQRGNEDMDWAYGKPQDSESSSDDLFEVRYADKTYKLHFAYLGGKGDWDGRDRNIFDVLVWTIESTNNFFKPFYGWAAWTDEDFIGKVARISRRQSTVKEAVRRRRRAAALLKQRGWLQEWEARKERKKLQEKLKAERASEDARASASSA
ncbi:hypothetical protein AK812_SmicGene683 [Symbiodinium microadriaticum]|uniref:Uncharacterized protein n=1 Tax=Symbiodinium microadriaticum TaxID=2951 RepID=A0A1Q9F628_SYMMI|nr:hypothetical protein AK812_SmicGene683 [Symbiodinium microadriaticum]